MAYGITFAGASEVHKKEYESSQKEEYRPAE
jgi:hypothetical protein